MSGIRVVCRIRPENKVEKESGGDICLEYSDYTINLLSQERAEDVHKFTFDRVCGPDCTQSEVFEAAAQPVVEGVLDGYNGTIFAYGQTGSGKTFTMEGPNIHDAELKGIIPRMMDALFVGLVHSSETSEFTLKCSFLEIYLERIQDLLDSSKSNLHLKEDKNRGIYVQDATEVYVGSPTEMLDVMTAGSRNRSIAATRMNARSSRSHSIFCVHVDQRDTETGSRRSGRLYFVDLAGSEKIAKTHVTGKQLEEAKMINKSLSALGNVINALTEKNTGFVPYRDSKLTRMLQESLGGNSQTTLVIAVSRNSYNDKETLSTLRFGLRAKKIQNKPIINQEMSAKELMKQLEQAQKEISKQSEIIANLSTHIQNKYADNQSLVSEVLGIIENSFTVAPAPATKHESEHSLILLKQHMEIVNLNEELQQIKLEKKELEDEWNYRSKEITDYDHTIQELTSQIAYENEMHNHTVEELQVNLERALFEKQQTFLQIKKARKAIERLHSDVQLVRNEIPKEDGWAEILQKSLQEALNVITDIDGSLESPAKDLETSTERATNTEDSHLFVPEDPKTDYKILLSEQRSTIDNLQRHNSDLQEEIETLHQSYAEEKDTLKLKAEEFAEKLDSATHQVQVLEKQLEQKVKNIEEERATVALDLKYKDEEIMELKMLLLQEREQLEKLLINNTPKERRSDLEERLSELCTERQKLYEELVSQRKILDQRDEQLHNALQRNHRLERQLSNNRNNATRLTSPRNRPALQEPTFFNKKIMKPIRGGGGDLWNFQQRNQGVVKNNQSSVDNVIRSQQKIERLASHNKTGIGTIVKDFFGGLLS